MKNLANPLIMSIMIATIAFTFLACEEKDKADSACKAETGSEPQFDIYGKWKYIVLPSSPNEWKSTPPSITINSDNSVSALFSEKRSIGAISKTEAHKIRIRILSTEAGGMKQPVDGCEEWNLVYDPATNRLVYGENIFRKEIDYSQALQTHFPKGTLGASGKTRPIEMFFQKVLKNGDSYPIVGKSKTSAAEDAFSGTLSIISQTAGGSCGSGETELKGSYNLKEKVSKTSGHFVGNFTACEKSGKLSKASFKGDWVKDANGNRTPCNFEL